MVESSLVSRPSYHGVPVRGPGNNGLRMRLIKPNLQAHVPRHDCSTIDN